VSHSFLSRSLFQEIEETEKEKEKEKAKKN